MEIESPLEWSIHNDRPFASTDWVHFVFSFPGKFQAFCLLVGLNTIIDVPMDGAKLKFAQIILPQCHITCNNEVDVILTPLLHLYDTPCAHIRVVHGVLLTFRLHTPP